MDTDNSKAAKSLFNSKGSYYNKNLKSKKIHISKKNNNNVSKSWNYTDRFNNFNNNDKSTSLKDNFLSDNYKNNMYDAVKNCKSAGIIPYCIHDNKIYFLLQQTKTPKKKKMMGWNDFGGKRIDQYETTADAAAREFSEETSCLFYLVENSCENSQIMYDKIKNNGSAEISESVELIKELIPRSQKFYHDKITEFVVPIYASSKETYISYFVKVEYLPETDLHPTEDIHIDYEFRYLRECKWFSIDEIKSLSEKDFHKRLQITKIKQRIENYVSKNLLV